ncbi:hypothetical protein [Sphingobium algorifonticola]|uniref:Uncharacterized protein n=1 Tax=Sphingobium algorifonticola TaxID=2008318 RepID=A0A437J2I6_9SPHN|nr:hypothetical protein [Sphingobium algorifonticola]RVT38383.1 hypothetical protein ENE74_17710 [Sphingobium algorifonticola]
MSVLHLPFTLGDQTFDLAHLSASTFGCPTDFRPGDLTIGIRYSNHCYTTGCAEDHDPGERLILDHHGNRRAFDDHRYTLSLTLPALLGALPTARVWQSFRERNYMHFSTALGPAEYRVFFQLRRASPGAGHDLALFVESAYAIDPADPATRGRGQIRFPILARKTFLGEPVRFDHGRNLRRR